MKTARYATTRQKSCQQCSNAKVRCDRRQGRCTRCTQRGLPCVYRARTALSNEGAGTDWSTGGLEMNATSLEDISLPSPSSEPFTHALEATASGAHPPRISLNSFTTTNQNNLETLDLTSLDLTCPINVDEIKNRWLNPYIPGPDQAIKEYPASVTRFIYRTLKAYAGMAARGRVLPFIHPALLKAQPEGSPLTTCLSLVQISKSPLPGSENSAALVLQRELENIAAIRKNYDDMSLLAAFQACLIYTMVLFFRLNQGPTPFFRGAMMDLQELGCASSRRGLVCAADERHARPRWEEWIVTETKRRTLYVMYLFDSVLSIQENLPTFLGTELRGLPAPSSKTLWQTANRDDWEKEYNVFLAEWTERSLAIDELWPIPAGFDEAAIARRRMRVDRWLEDLDEYGMMMFAVTGCTHGD